MTVQNSDLLLVQRGEQPYRTTAEDLSTKVRSDIDVSGPNKDIPVATAGQLGVIRIGANLSIDANGVLDAVLPAGTSYEGVWTDASTPPTVTNSGEFWIWEGGDATLNNALWGQANGDAVSDNDRLLYDGTGFDVLPAGSGGGIAAVTGAAPIVVTTNVISEPEVSITAASASAPGSMSKEDFSKLAGIDPGAQANINPTQAYTPAAEGGSLTLTPGGDVTNLPDATTDAAGLMSAADKTQLDSLVATPGGVVSLTAGDGLVNSGTSTAPILDVDFGTLTNGDPATEKVMPYNINSLGDLP